MGTPNNEIEAAATPAAATTTTETSTTSVEVAEIIDAEVVTDDPIALCITRKNGPPLNVTLSRVLAGFEDLRLKLDAERTEASNVLKELLRDGKDEEAIDMSVRLMAYSEVIATLDYNSDPDDFDSDDYNGLEVVSTEGDPDDTTRGCWGAMTGIQAMSPEEAATMRPDYHGEAPGEEPQQESPPDSTEASTAPTDTITAPDSVEPKPDTPKEGYAKNSPIN